MTPNGLETVCSQILDMERNTVLKRNHEICFQTLRQMYEFLADRSPDEFVTNMQHLEADLQNVATNRRHLDAHLQNVVKAAE